MHVCMGDGGEGGAGVFREAIKELQWGMRHQHSGWWQRLFFSASATRRWSHFLRIGQFTETEKKGLLGPMRLNELALAVGFEAQEDLSEAVGEGGVHDFVRGVAPLGKSTKTFPSSQKWLLSNSSLEICTGRYTR